MRKDVCPACGRYSAQLSTCEYCDADLPAADLIRTWRRVTALCAVTGLLILWHATGETDVKRVWAEQVSPSMNHAMVRVEGRIVSKPFASTQSQAAAYVSFLINDNSGTLRVCMHGEEATHFLAAGPKEGQVLEAVGALQVRAGRQPRVFVRGRRGRESWKLRH